MLGIRLFRHTLFRHRIIRHGNFATGNIRHRNFCHKFLLRKIRHNNSEMWQKIRMGNLTLIQFSSTIQNYMSCLSVRGISKTDFIRYMSNNCGEIFGQITLGLNGLSQVSQVGLAQGYFGVITHIPDEVRLGDSLQYGMDSITLFIDVGKFM